MKKVFIVFLFLIPFIASNTFASPVQDSKAFLDRNEQWGNFRAKFRYHIQVIAVKKYIDNSVNIILSEPPNRVTEADIQSILKKINASLELKQWNIGVNGWVKDAVISATGLNSFTLNNMLSELNELLFVTSYKADYLDLENLLATKPLVNLNYQITAAELQKWFLADAMNFYSGGNKNGNLQLKNILNSKSYGEYFSNSNGFVLLVLPSGQDISNQQKNIRKFSLDADLIIGAIFANNTLAVIGRERKESVYALPPLRTESVLLLAAANKTQLAQSYERNSLFAGKLINKKDWAPIYLSKELINTEYGSLLNITDQMLKSWSQRGQIKYDNFEYPIPDSFPFRKTIFNEVGSSSLTYNWNTGGVGYAINTGGFQVYAVNRTGSLPVSYFPDSSDVNQNMARYEAGAYDYFSSLNDPNLVRVGQYTFLYQIFSAFNITASAGNLNKLQEVRDILTEPTINLFQKIIKRDEITKLSLELSGNFLKGKELSTYLKTYNSMYGESGVREIAKLANDREALSNIDKAYFRIIKLFREYGKQRILDSQYLISRNAIVPRHNILGKNLHRSHEEELERIRLSDQIKGYDLIIDQLEAELKRMENEIIMLSDAADDRLALRTKILQRISIANGLVDWDIDLRDTIKTNYAYAHDIVNNNTWIKTASIVISQDTLNVEMVGGHNIDAAINRFVFDATVPRGSFKMTTLNGRNVIKINPIDAGRVNGTFLKDVKYVDSHIAGANATKNLQLSFTNNHSLPPRKADEIFGPSKNVNSGYNSEHNIGWAYEENAQSSNALIIKKTEEGYYTINNKKTTICYNLKESIEDHLSNQPDAVGVIEFANFSDDEVRFFSENVASKLKTNTAKSRWIVFREKREAITALDYDFTNKTIQQLDNGNIRIAIPKKTTSSTILIDLVGIGKSLFQQAKTSIEKVFIIGKAKPSNDIVTNLMAEFKSAGIPLNKIIVSADDCTICIKINFDNKNNS